MSCFDLKVQMNVEVRQGIEGSANSRQMSFKQALHATSQVDEPPCSPSPAAVSVFKL